MRCYRNEKNKIKRVLAINDFEVNNKQCGNVCMFILV